MLALESHQNDQDLFFLKTKKIEYNVNPAESNELSNLYR